MVAKLSHVARFRGLVLCAGGALFAALLLGCSGGDGDGPSRHRLTGTVTLDGQPVASGQIFFDPDVSQGNSGPQAYATIKDGKYDTSAGEGKGHVGGPHKVSISGPDFHYESKTPVNLPKENGEQNFDLKGSEVQKVAPSATPA
jgi:hypothetical protein